MNNPFLKNTTTRLSYLGIWVLIALAQVAVFLYTFSLTDVKDLIYQYTIYDISVYCLIFAALVLVIWYPVRYYRSTFGIPLFLLFHFLLFLLVAGISLGAGYLISKALLSHYPYYTTYFLLMLPYKLLSGVLLYVVFVMFYYLDLTTSEIKHQNKMIEEQADNNPSKPIEKLSRISVRKGKEIQFIPVNRIFYIEANGDYVLIHTEAGRFLKDSTMKYWELHLPDGLFLRIHRSFIVNLEQIEQVSLYEKDSYRLKMKNGALLKASQSGYKLLKQHMQL